ncbi:FtsJ-domain-containing protein [Fomitiporia mediterranea MF3/22]|uniref:FtsJ-domain-containing protein n=1 Tax=Fomitiporia mediterranea (strain MF3/22) TaxID=694068 RepID=UPI0004407BA9|nr:FtsJ-domain-containing protein [Fomitiporia mediterranea MF3/22]EJD03897.1 FtsJ-domain-containing protein [Fomitiporia mediterranea MF3/22]
MGKAQKKTGKGRLDKYYKLAKEQGYRARSAFKLIQLNKKYSFLESAKCCIDLCAAPGGWLQVASKYMPVNSIIVGVDLVPIRPIPRVSTFAADITTPQCRNLIRGELKDWKADVVLHDGAPNVGTAWVQDAYSQSELVLMSLRLAVEFLIKGGTFVTKVFRSADYNNLIWVFNQLFGKVEVTKPPSSRNVSAEIFVVCRDFYAPKHIDPKFLDPKYAFKELTSSALSTDKGATSINAHANVFMPEKKRRHRDGYAEGDYTLHKSMTAAEFIKCPDPVSFLGSVNRIVFQSEEEKQWAALDITTPDIKANLEDLKVLGKGDFKALIKWRSALRTELGLDNVSVPTEELTETVEIVEEVDQEQAIEEELERFNAEASARAKRERRKANEAKTRTIQRMQLQMTAPLDIGLEQSDGNLGLGQDDMFDLETAENGVGKRRSVAGLVTDRDQGSESDNSSSEPGTDDDEEEVDGEEGEARIAGLEAELDGLYDAYKERLNERDAKFKAREARKHKEKEDWFGIGTEKSDEEDVSGEEGGWDRVEEAKAGADDDSSSDDSSDNDSESSEETPLKGRKRKPGSTREPSAKKTKLVSNLVNNKTSRTAQLWFDQEVFKDVDMDNIEDDEDDEGLQSSAGEDDSDEANDSNEVSDSENDFEVVPKGNDEDIEMWDANGASDNEGKEAKALKNGLMTAEAVTLAQQLVNREKTKTQLINDGFNRYSLNSKEGLPPWFLDDEAKHYKPNIPVTKEAIDILRARQRALDARPIKKVAEAKARKKHKALQKLQKAMKKAEGVNESTDMSEREKAQQIQKLMLKGLAKAKQKKSEVKVVVAKGPHRGIQGRPKGVKGRYRMVDSRGKKELRAKKRQEKANKKRR